MEERDAVQLSRIIVQSCKDREIRPPRRIFCSNKITHTHTRFLTRVPQGFLNNRDIASTHVALVFLCFEQLKQISS